MTRLFVTPLAVAAVAGTLAAQDASRAPGTDADRFWPAWRGPHATGVSTHANPPLEWSETRNIRWKIRVPGRGSASPVVWNDRLYLLTAVPADGGDEHAPRGGVSPRVPHRYLVLAINRSDGSVAWQRVAREETPHEASHHQFGTWASSSAVTDGRYVFAYFESRGLYAYDMAGRLVWEKDLGDRRMRNEFGEGTSPALHGNTLVVQWDHQGQSFVVALDARDGRELWRAARDEIDGWATPLIVEAGGRTQVVTNGTNQVRAYDLQTGALVWEGAGTTPNPIPSPVGADGMVFLMGGYRGNDLKAVRLADARGDLAKSGAVRWTLDRNTPYVPSPLLYDGILYIIRGNSGQLSAFDAQTGKPHYQVQRLEGAPNVFSSPVAAAGRIYVPSQDGTTMVLRHGPVFEPLATNALDDGFDASMALVDDTIYLRGYRHLYAIADEGRASRRDVPASGGQVPGAASSKGAGTSKNSPRIITEGGIPNI